MSEVRLYHAYRGPAVVAHEWAEQVQSEGLKTKNQLPQYNADSIRDKYVYLYDADQPVPLGDLPNKPNAEVQVPKDQVYASNFDILESDSADWQEEWRNSLVPYREWEQNGGFETDEFVVEGGVDPEYVVDIHMNGLPETASV